RYANDIRDILDNPPAANLYQHLKTELTLPPVTIGRPETILQAQPTLPLDQLTEIADRVIEASVPPLSPTVQTVGAPLDTRELAHRIDDITRQLSSIQRRLDQSPPTRPRYRSQSRDRNTGPPSHLRHRSSHKAADPCRLRL
ncbi:hypothetical protein HPB47_004655, partial [Ixodes persulcatus]